MHILLRTIGKLLSLFFLLGLRDFGFGFLALVVILFLVTQIFNLLPSEVFIVATEVASRRCFLVNGSLKVKLLNDHAWP